MLWPHMKHFLHRSLDHVERHLQPLLAAVTLLHTLLNHSKSNYMRESISGIYMFMLTNKSMQHVQCHVSFQRAYRIVGKFGDLAIAKLTTNFIDAIAPYITHASSHQI